MTSKQSNSDVASSSKRRKVSLDTISDSDGEPHVLTLEVRDRAAITQEPTSKSLSRPITPPLAKRAQSTPAKTASSQQDGKGKRKRDVDEPESVSKSDIEDGRNEQSTSPDIAFIPSPLQLTRIRDLPVSHNEDTIGIGEILGDPLIKECWNFNFLFDLDWVMQQLDQDVRGQVQMRIVHGFWKKEDRSKRKLEEAASKYLNVKPIAAYIPDMFGTHHSKMLVLIRHDDLAQVIIHTANMIPRDWRNMTQAVWRSPLLPLRPSTNDLSEKENHPIGTGKRFKVDLLRYIGAYGWRLSELKSQLKNYDFSAIRAAFIGSSPSREKPGDAKSDLQTSWGWPGVQQILSTVPHVSAATSAGEEEAAADIVIQTSSIATLGANTTWLDNFKHALWKRSVESDIDAPAYPYSPTLNIIWPTAQEIRTSLDGYASGGSIHMKTTSKIQEKQLNYLKPYFRH